MTPSLPANTNKNRLSLQVINLLVTWSLLQFLVVTSLHAQSTSPGIAHQKKIQATLDNIHQWENAGVSSEQLGLMWSTLGSAYLDESNLEPAEKAYIRALQIIKSTAGENGNYATALEDLSLVYVLMENKQEAENCRKAALEIRKRLGDQLGIARNYEYMAITDLHQSKFKESEKYSTLAYNTLKTLVPADIGDQLTTLLIRAYARCYWKKCSQGMEDIQLLQTIAGAAVQSNSTLAGEILFVRGFATWKLGDIENGREIMRRGLDVLERSSVSPNSNLTHALIQYQLCLKAGHHDKEATEVADQIAANIRNQPHPSCSNCTVSIYGMANSWR